MIGLWGVNKGIFNSLSLVNSHLCHAHNYYLDYNQTMLCEVLVVPTIDTPTHAGFLSLDTTSYHLKWKIKPTWIVKACRTSRQVKAIFKASHSVYSSWRLVYAIFNINRATQLSVFASYNLPIIGI